MMMLKLFRSMIILKQNTGLYLEVFEFDNLKIAITKALDSGKNILIEGICLNEVLQNISTESGFKVYIKELGILEEWYWDKYLDETKTAEEIFVEDVKELEDDILEDSNSDGENKILADDDLSKQRKGVFYDLVRYPREYKPQDNSDLIFERLDKNV